MSFAVTSRERDDCAAQHNAVAGIDPSLMSNAPDSELLREQAEWSSRMLAGTSGPCCASNPHPTKSTQPGGLFLSLSAVWDKVSSDFTELLYSQVSYNHQTVPVSVLAHDRLFIT